MAFKSDDGSTAQLVFREMLPDGDTMTDLSKIEIDLAEGGVETVRIDGTDFAMTDILAGAATGSGVSMEWDTPDHIVDRLEDALDDALEGGASGTFYQSDVEGAVAETIDYVEMDDVIDPLA